MEDDDFKAAADEHAAAEDKLIEAQRSIVAASAASADGADIICRGAASAERKCIIRGRRGRICAADARWTIARRRQGGTGRR